MTQTLLLNGQMKERNPRYYEEESRINEYLGFNRSNENNHSTVDYKKQWEDEYNFEVIGTQLLP
jgi:hypothetical protein